MTRTEADATRFADSPTAFMTPEELKKYDRGQTAIGAVIVLAVIVVIFGGLWLWVQS